MTSWRTLVGNSETLTAADLDNVGGQVTAVIESVTGAQFEDEDKNVDKKALIAFRGKHLKLAANTINCLLLEALWGEDFEGWIGHKVTLGSDTVEVAGRFKGRPCIRVKGSPEISEPVSVQIKLPHRKPLVRKLVPTAKARRELPDDELDQDSQRFIDEADIPFGDEVGAAAIDEGEQDGLGA